MKVHTTSPGDMLVTENCLEDDLNDKMFIPYFTKTGFMMLISLIESEMDGRTDIQLVRCPGLALFRRCNMCQKKNIILIGSTNDDFT
jgi:hypothetical protein